MVWHNRLICTVSVFLQFKGNFVRSQNNSKYRDRARSSPQCALARVCLRFFLLLFHARRHLSSKFHVNRNYAWEATRNFMFRSFSYPFAALKTIKQLKKEFQRPQRSICILPGEGVFVYKHSEQYELEIIFRQNRVERSICCKIKIS